MKFSTEKIVSRGDQGLSKAVWQINNSSRAIGHIEVEYSDSYLESWRILNVRVSFVSGGVKMFGTVDEAMRHVRSVVKSNPSVLTV